MKKLLLCIATSVMAMGAMAQIQVKSNGTVVFPNNVKIENTSGNIYLPGNTDIRFGCDATWASPKWAVEYFGGGLNFWKPNNPAGSQDYLFFLSDNGRVGIGCGNSPLNKLHVVGNVYIQAASGSGSLQIQTGTSDPRLATSSTDIVLYRSSLNAFANLQCLRLYEKSDSVAKTNIKHLEYGSLDKICKLNGYSYNWKNDDSGKTEIGFIAQEVEKVFPDIVKTVDSTGEKMLAYTSIIPHLVEAIKEQQKEIENLKTQLNAEKSYELKSTSVVDIHSSVEQASLSQNKPNPFSTNTRIEMVIPETVADAVLYIYDLQGKQVKSIMVTGRGNTSETIFGNELEAGLYIYSLVTDGKLVGSKQMILTE